MRVRALHRNTPLPRLRPPPSARWRCSASSPTTRARRSGRCSPSASRSRPPCSGCSSSRSGASARAPHARPPRRRDRARASARFGYAAQAGCFFAALERIDASLLSLLLYTFPAMVAVAAIALGRERADRRAARRARARLGAASCWSSRTRARARSTPLGAGARARRGDHLHHLHPREPGHRRPRPADRAVRARLHRRRGEPRRSARRCSASCAPGEVTAAGWGWLAGIAVVSTVAAVSLFFAGLKRVGSHDRLDPLDRRAGRDRAARVPRVRRAARPAAAPRRPARDRGGPGARELPSA